MVAFTKRLLVKHGGLHPTLLIEGTTGSDARPLPDAREAIKLSLLDALGYTLAAENAVGDLVSLWLVSEGWASRRPYQAGVPATQPKHAADRQEVVMVFRYEPATTAKAMIVYETIRNDNGELTELRPLTQSDRSGELVHSAPMEAFITGFARGRAGRTAA